MNEQVSNSTATHGYTQGDELKQKNDGRPETEIMTKNGVGVEKQEMKISEKDGHKRSKEQKPMTTWKCVCGISCVHKNDQ